jgi:hypothetical protein
MLLSRMQLSKKASVFVVSALSSVWALSASADVILDHYIGSDDHGYGDVIGQPGSFDVSAVDINLAGSLLSIDVTTSFANNGVGTYPSLTNTPLSNGNGIGFGDLFLANEWTPSGSAPYTTDNWQTGTDWDYGFALDNRWSQGGTGNWYELGDTQNGDVDLSDDYLSGGIFRNGQEVAVDKTMATATAMLGQPMSWSVDGANNRVSFTFDIAGTSLENSDVIGFHWGMTCGNDVIEGAYNRVPEPGTLALLGLGLSIMLVRVGRLKRSNRQAV